MIQVLLTLTEDRNLKQNHLIKLKVIFSDWGKLKHGVPQGSILEPLLFKCTQLTS